MASSWRCKRCGRDVWLVLDHVAELADCLDGRCPGHFEHPPTRRCDLDGVDLTHEQVDRVDVAPDHLVGVSFRDGLIRRVASELPRFEVRELPPNPDGRCLICDHGELLPPADGEPRALWRWSCGHTIDASR